MKKILSIGILVLIVSLVSGCDLINRRGTEAQREAVAIFENLTAGMTSERVEQIITVNDVTTGIYHNGMIIVDYNNDVAVLLELELSENRAEIRDSETVLTNAQSFVDRINNNERVTYEELYNSFNTSGICTRKENNGCTRYEWADSRGRFVTVTITEGAVSALSGRL